MSVVSVRLSDEVESFFRKHGIAPGVRARELLEREAERIRLKENLAFLDSVSRKPSKRLVDLLREERDAH
ncbi:MAG TPA: hypothetical protein VI796_05235 [Candidatus Thermoplasmatota archaeon]|nr:hypothetical protein [Candidatus Thermoplasmatota archaeon]